MMSFTTTVITLAALASTALALPVPAADNVISKRYSGVRMTYYDTSVGLGACGNLNQNSAWTVALNSAQFGGGYPSPECGKTITISMGGKTAQAVIQDACPSCPYGGLDLSPSLFQHFAVSFPHLPRLDMVGPDWIADRIRFDDTGLGSRCHSRRLGLRLWSSSPSSPASS